MLQPLFLIESAGGVGSRFLEVFFVTLNLELSLVVYGNFLIYCAINISFRFVSSGKWRHVRMKYLIEGGHNNMRSQNFLCNLVRGGVLLNGVVKIC